MTDSIVQACSDYQTVIANYDMQSGQDNSDSAQDAMADVLTLMQDLVIYAPFAGATNV